MSSRERVEAPALGGMLERMLRALVRRAGEGEAEALEELARLEELVDEALTAGVHAHREGPAAASWAKIGELVGTSRQAAFRRHGAVAQ